MAYSELIATEIITRVSNGETLRAICRSHDEFPDESTVRQWYSENVKGFAPRYARAREAQAEAWSDEIIEVADAELKEGANRD